MTKFFKKIFCLFLLIKPKHRDRLRNSTKNGCIFSPQNLLTPAASFCFANRSKTTGARIFWCKKILPFFVSVLTINLAAWVNPALNGFTFSLSFSNEELTLISQKIIVGKVKKIKSDWTGDRSMIYTSVTIEVLQFLKGGNNSKELILEIPGGEVGDVGLKISEIPGFSLNEEVIVFLSPKKIANVFAVVGGSQGKYAPSPLFINRIKRIIREQRK